MSKLLQLKLVTTLISSPTLKSSNTQKSVQMTTMKKIFKNKTPTYTLQVISLTPYLAMLLTRLTESTIGYGERRSEISI